MSFSTVIFNLLWYTFLVRSTKMKRIMPKNEAKLVNGTIECYDCEISCSSTNFSCQNRKIKCMEGKCIINCDESCNSLQLNTTQHTITNLNCISTNSESCQNIKIDTYGLTRFNCESNQNCHDNTVTVYPKGKIKLTEPHEDWYSGTKITLHEESFSNLVENPSLDIIYLDDALNNTAARRLTTYCDGCTYYCDTYEECEYDYFYCYSGSCTLYCDAYDACYALNVVVYDDAYLNIWCYSGYDYTCDYIDFLVGGDLDHYCYSDNCWYGDYVIYSEGDLTLYNSYYGYYYGSEIYMYSGASVTVSSSATGITYYTDSSYYTPLASSSDNNNNKNKNNGLSAGAIVGIVFAIIICIAVVIIIIICKCTKCTWNTCKECCNNLSTDPKTSQQNNNQNNPETQNLTSGQPNQGTNVVPVVEGPNAQSTVSGVSNQNTQPQIQQVQYVQPVQQVQQIQQEQQPPPVYMAQPVQNQNPPPPYVPQQVQNT